MLFISTHLKYSTKFQQKSNQITTHQIDFRPLYSEVLLGGDSPNSPRANGGDGGEDAGQEDITSLLDQVGRCAVLCCAAPCCAVMCCAVLCCGWCCAVVGAVSGGCCALSLRWTGGFGATAQGRPHRITAAERTDLRRSRWQPHPPTPPALLLSPHQPATHQGLFVHAGGFEGAIGGRPAETTVLLAGLSGDVASAVAKELVFRGVSWERLLFCEFF